MTIKVEIAAGGVVRLKSGGPWMTVAREPDQNGETQCVWFGADGIEQRADDFAAVTLEVKDEDRRLHEALEAMARRVAALEKAGLAVCRAVAHDHDPALPEVQAFFALTSKAVA